MKKFLLPFLTGILSLSVSGQSLNDPSLEASGAGGTVWTSTSSNFGTSFCDEAGCGTCGGPCVPNTGDFYAWFGGTTNSETGTISQTFNVTTTGTAELKYFWKVPMKGNTGDTLSVIIDGTTLSKVNTIDSIGAYQEITIDAGTIAAGSHNLTIKFQKLASASVVNVLVDDIQLFVQGNVNVEEVDFSNGIQISNNIQTGNITVAYNFNTSRDFDLIATDLNGKVMYKNAFFNQQVNEQVISSEEWTPGIYIITLKSTDGFIKTHKAIVQ